MEAAQLDTDLRTITGEATMVVGPAFMTGTLIVEQKEPPTFEQRIDAIEARLDSEAEKLHTRVDDAEARMKAELTRRIEAAQRSTRREIDNLKRNAQQRHSDLQRRRRALTLVALGGTCSSAAALISIFS